MGVIGSDSVDLPGLANCSTDGSHSSIFAPWNVVSMEGCAYAGRVAVLCAAEALND